MRTRIAAMSVVFAGLTLSGCQSPLLAGWGFSKKAPAAGAFSRPAADPLVALEEGRIYLRNGQISAAVASFKIAQLDPAAAPDAKNGLGVAYVKLGRPDVADRYFREALALRPGEDRYAANLLRLQRNVMLARGTPADPLPTTGDGDAAQVAAAATPAPITPTEPAPATARLARARTPVLRITTGEGNAAAPRVEVVSRLASADPSLPKVASRTTGEKSSQSKAEAAKPLEVVF